MPTGPNSPYGSTPLPGGGPITPLPTGPQYPFGANPGNSFTTSQQQQIQSAFSAAGIWETIQNLGGDIWGAIAKVLPKTADGSIDWGAIGSDVMKWVKENKGTILDGLSAYNQYERSKKSDEYAQKAIEAKQKSYDAKEPLRVAGMAGMLNPQANTPDLSALKAKANAAPMQMPLPVAPNTTNFQNAQRIAGSGNPFTQSLPTPNVPGPLPVANGPTVARPGFDPQARPSIPETGRGVTPPGATVQPLPMSPLDLSRKMPISGIGARLAPLPIASINDQRGY